MDKVRITTDSYNIVYRADFRKAYYRMTGEFGIVYKGYLAGQYTNEIVAIKTLKGMNIFIVSVVIFQDERFPL